MLFLAVGLILFLGVHSIRIAANDWRSHFMELRGEQTYKGLYSLVSVVGLVLIVFGFSQTRLNPVFVWTPPAAMAHIAALLTLIAFVLLAAAYIPGNRIKGAVGHPMVLSVKVWAFAHLLANGRLGDMILFGAFLAWAIIDYVVSRRRDRQSGVVNSIMPSFSRDAMVVAIGGFAWLVMAMWLHVKLIGVSPF